MQFLYCSSQQQLQEQWWHVFSRVQITDRLKDFIAQLTIESSANSLTDSLADIEIKVSRDTILRVVKKRSHCDQTTSEV